MNNISNYTIYIMMSLKEESKSLKEIAMSFKNYSHDLLGILEQLVDGNLITKDDKYSLTDRGLLIVNQLDYLYKDKLMY